MKFYFSIASSTVSKVTTVQRKRDKPEAQLVQGPTPVQCTTIPIHESILSMQYMKVNKVLLASYNHLMLHDKYLHLYIQAHNPGYPTVSHTYAHSHSSYSYSHTPMYTLVVHPLTATHKPFNLSIYTYMCSYTAI